MAESYEQSGARCRDDKNKELSPPAVAECTFLRDTFEYDGETKKLNVSCEVGKERISYGFECQNDATAKAKWKLTDRSNSNRVPAQSLGRVEPGGGAGVNFLTQPPEKLDPKASPAGKGAPGPTR